MSIIDDQQSQSAVTTNATRPSPPLRWSVIPRVPHLALIAHRGDLPVAVIEPGGNASYRLTTSRGVTLGSFPTIGEAQEAFAEHVAAHR